jgi:hypothetical protein
VRDLLLASCFGLDPVSLPTFNAEHRRYRTLLLERASSIDLSQVLMLGQALNTAPEELEQMR